jgi:hypothetical protein
MNIVLPHQYAGFSPGMAGGYPAGGGADVNRGFSEIAGNTVVVQLG